MSRHFSAFRPSLLQSDSDLENAVLASVRTTIQDRHPGQLVENTIRQIQKSFQVDNEPLAAII
jgi:hypothetical protein